MHTILRPLMFVPLLFVSLITFCQSKNLKAVELIQQQAEGKDSIVYVDSNYNYQVTVPKWWHLLATPEAAFGGTFPAVDSIENALVIKSFKKDKFKDLADFEDWVIRKYSLGQAFEWSNDSKFMLRKELTDFNGPGDAFKIQLLRFRQIYMCCYILTQTSSAYIWIDFTATNETYAKNFERFREVVSLFKKR